MTESPPSFGLQLYFFSPSHRHSSLGGTCVQPPYVCKVVLVSSPLIVTKGGFGFEECWDVEQDCADCDCACFTDDD